MLWSRSQAGYEPGNGRFVMFHSPTVHCVLRLKHPDVCLQHLRQSQVSFHLMARMHSIHMLMCTHTYRQTDRQTDRHTYRQRDRHTDRQTDRQTDTHTHTDRQTHTHTRWQVVTCIRSIHRSHSMHYRKSKLDVDLLLIGRIKISQYKSSVQAQENIQRNPSIVDTLGTCPIYSGTPLLRTP